MATGPRALDQPQDVGIKTIIYGSTGVGKTVLAGSSRSMRTLVLDVDIGTDSLRARAPRPDLIKVWEIRSFADFLAAFAWLEANLNQFDLIVVDTASELQQVLIGEVCERNKHATPDQRDWGVVLSQMELVTRRFRGLPKHVLFLAHEIEREDEELHRVVWRPDFQGAYGLRKYGRHFGIIARYLVVDHQVQDPNTKALTYVSHRLLNCQRDQVTHAKDRSSALAKFESPDNGIDYLFSKYWAGITRQPTGGQE